MGMDPARKQLRRYVSQIGTLLDYLDTHPGEMAYWLDFDFQVVVKFPPDLPDPLAQTELDDYSRIRDRACALGLCIYPALRTQPSSSFYFADYMKTDFWQKNADRLISVAALRKCGPWIGIDMENFKWPDADPNHVPPVLPPPPAAGSGIEPSLRALGHGPLGGSVSELRAAMQPFIDALHATKAKVAVYPAEVFGEDLAYVAESLGRERVELWIEDTYPNSEHYRLSPERQWPADAATFLRVMGQLQSRFPDYIVRPGISDLERSWAEPYRGDLLRGGPIAPYGFDYTRFDADQFGSPEYRLGTTLTELNHVLHVWPMHPMGLSVPAVFDTGSTSAPLAQQVGTIEGPTSAISPSPHLDGIHFVSPPPPPCALRPFPTSGRVSSA